MSTLAELRVARGWSQVELAVKSGVSVGTVTRAENGRMIQKSGIILMCQALGVNVEDVTGVNLVQRVKIRKETHTTE